MNDVVIIGAGSAGCVLAEWLGRSGRLKVKPSTPIDRCGCWA